MAWKKMSPAEKKQHREQQAERLQASITEQVSALRDSEEWKKFLKFSQSFHHYSLNNVLLILAQCPAATRVAGFKKWQEHGRTVRKGEHGIKILGYATRTYTEKDTAGEEKEHKIAYFPPVTVFDISQTDGEDVPSIAHALTGDDPRNILGAVTAYLSSIGWTVEREPIAGEANGYTTLDGTYRVVIDSGLSDAQAAKTALHETAHVLAHTENGKAHSEKKERSIQEIEAESIAYVVAGILGQDTSAYSIGYVAGWSGFSEDAIKATATTVLDTAKKIVAALEPALAPA